MIIRSLKLITVLALIGLPVASAQPDPKETKDNLIMRTPPRADDPSKAITIHQEIDFNASPQRIYEALLDTKQFSAFSRPTSRD